MTDIQVIRVSQRSDGMDQATAEWEGREFKSASRNGATMAVSRLLCAAGRPECAWVAVDSQNGKERFHGDSLSQLSNTTVAEGAKPPRLVRWEPYEPAGDEGEVMSPVATRLRTPHAEREAKQKAFHRVRASPLPKSNSGIVVL